MPAPNPSPNRTEHAHELTLLVHGIISNPSFMENKEVGSSASDSKIVGFAVSLYSHILKAADSISGPGS